MSKPQKPDAGEVREGIAGGSRPPHPPSPSNRNTSSRNIHNEDPYISRYAQGVPEQRLHKSKSRSVKLNQSAKDSKLETTVRVNESLVTVREEPVLVNSAHNGGDHVPGFEEAEFENKKFKKFSISALIKEKDLIKESNYFDESHLGQTYLKPIDDRANADFRIGDFEHLETFQVKTFLFDRNLTAKIPQ